MARIEIYGNDSNVTLDDKVIGTDALDNSTKNFTVGDIVALASAGTALMAGTGIDITNGVISSTIVDTDTNNFISNVALNGTNLDFTGTGGAYNASIPLSSIADKPVSLTGTGGIAITGTYPSFTIDGSAISGGGTVTGTGTANIMTKWITSTQIGSSIVVEDGTGVGIGVQPPEARLHVHTPGNTSSLKITTQGSGIGPQDGLNISLIDNQFAQMWLYEPNISLRFGTNNAERFRIDGAGQGWFQYGVRITGGIVDSNTTKGTAGQILSSTGSQVEWINAPSVVLPETLILKIANVSPIGIGVAPGTDIVFASAGAFVNSNSVHINQTDLNLANATDIEVVTDCTVKISLGAYIDNGGQAGQITFLIYEVSGAQTLVGSASFDLSNQAVGIIPTTFFSFFDFQAGEIYKFTAHSSQHAMTIVPGSFIQIEVLK